MAKDCVVGLDIGTTKVCAIVGEVSEDGRVDIVGVGSSVSAGIRKGVVIDIEDAARAISEAVAAARQRTNYVINSVVVGVTGEHIASLNSRGVMAVTHASREISAEDVNHVLQQARVIVLPPDREIIHAIPRTYTVDGQAGVRYPVGMAGTRLEVETHIVTGAVSLLQNVGKAVNRAGLSISATVLQPIASAEAVVTPAEKNLGVALVDIGGGTTDIAIFVDGDIAFSSVVPIAGVHVTRDISIGLRVSLEEAERLKREYGAASSSGLDLGAADTIDVNGLDGETRNVPRRQLLDIVNPRVEEIFTCIKNEIDKSGYYNFLPAGIVLTGGGALLPGMTTLCPEVTGLPARLGAPRDIVDLPETLRSPIHATGLGLVLYAARYTRNPGANAIAVSARISERMGGFMQSLQRFFNRIMGTDIEEEN
ncbi:MAG: cell division protein FtsA [Capsulimonadaceae bacterium]|nr:cell division protein FtsA [Capsulimonadaceae bacterium]